MSLHPEGLWGMHCFNALSEEQQTMVVVEGYLPLGWQPEGRCPNGADCEIVTVDDLTPGPRFYCYPCAITYLREREDAS